MALQASRLARLALSLGVGGAESTSMPSSGGSGGSHEELARSVDDGDTTTSARPNGPGSGGRGGIAGLGGNGGVAGGSGGKACSVRSISCSGSGGKGGNANSCGKLGGNGGIQAAFEGSVDSDASDIDIPSSGGRGGIHNGDSGGDGADGNITALVVTNGSLCACLAARLGERMVVGPLPLPCRNEHRSPNLQAPDTQCSHRGTEAGEKLAVPPCCKLLWRPCPPAAMLATLIVERSDRQSCERCGSNPTKTARPRAGCPSRRRARRLVGVLRWFNGWSQGAGGAVVTVWRCGTQKSR